MEEIVNPLKGYLDSNKESILAFARRAYIPATTLYNLYRGTKPRKKLALKICKHSRGNLKMKDFGYE